MIGGLYGEIGEEMRGMWPDAPLALLDYVVARVVLLRVVRHYNAAANAFDDATRDYFRTPLGSSTRLDRLERAAAAERTRGEAHRWADALAAVARVAAVERDRYMAWKGRRARAAERAGRTPPPSYVLPEDRGDAWEGQMDESVNFAVGAAPFLASARATLRIWSRFYATHAQHCTPLHVKR